MTGSSVHHYPLTILERHLDTFGHVNNATYLEIFEEARWALLTERGYGFAKIHDLRTGPTILECTLAFRRELRCRERVIVRTRLDSYVKKIFRLRQELYVELDPSAIQEREPPSAAQGREGEICCEATFIGGLFDLGQRKLIPPTPEWLASLGMEPHEWRPA